MSLETLFQSELAKRKQDIQEARKTYKELIEKNTIVDKETGLQVLDSERLYESNYRTICVNLNNSYIKYQVFEEYIFEMSDTGCNLSNGQPLEQYFDYSKDDYDHHSIFVDYIDEKNDQDYIYIMGQEFNVNFMRNKTPLEQIKIYFDLITRAMKLNGYTDKQIIECLNAVAACMNNSEKNSLNSMRK